MKENINIEFRNMLRKVVWDHDISDKDIIDIYFNNIQSLSLNKEQIKAKLLNSFSWHKLLQVMGDQAYDLLQDDVIKKVFPPSYRDGLFNAKRILSE